MRRRSEIPGAVVVVVAWLLCATPTAAAVRPAIVGGTAGAAPAMVARISTGDIACSGVLVAPRLVATARHCVAIVDPAPFACDEQARPIGPGGKVANDRAPSTFRIEVGGVTLGADSVVDDGAAHLCAHDVALLRLSSPAPVGPARVRLARGVDEGERVTVAGFGIDDGGLPPVDAQARTIAVEHVGPRAATATARAVAPGEFETGEGGCDGDSGGPALDGDGSVVGVYSRGGNDVPGCAGPGARNVYTDARTLVPLLVRALGDGEVVVDDAGAAHDAADLAARTQGRGCSVVATIRRRADGGDGVTVRLAVLLAVVVLARRRLYRAGRAA